MPCKIYLQVWILEFVGPLAPPAPHRLPRKELFLGNLSVIMKFRIRHFMLFWSLRVDWDTFQFQKACETQKNVFVFLKNSFHS